jgi:ABC-type dipeptide/oligopeptide/nickel transport system permease component
MELIGFIMAFAVGIAVGMYIATQLGEWIDRRSK